MISQQIDQDPLTYRKGTKRIKLFCILTMNIKEIFTLLLCFEGNTTSHLTSKSFPLTKNQNPPHHTTLLSQKKPRKPSSRKMCCGCRMCMLCTCVILVAIVIGLSFGLGVFKNGFHKVKDHLGVCDPNAIGSLCGGGKVSRPFLGFPASPPGPF
ncbi:hypothetical protein Peur_060456 [Populus x canadensis]